MLGETEVKLYLERVPPNALYVESRTCAPSPWNCGCRAMRPGWVDVGQTRGDLAVIRGCQSGIARPRGL